MSAHALLCAARAVIADPAHWTSFSAALSARSDCCEPLSRRAVRWDGLSALRVAGRRDAGLGGSIGEARATLDRVVPGGDYFAWERRFGRRHADVLPVFEAAIAASAAAAEAPR